MLILELLGWVSIIIGSVTIWYGVSNGEVFWGATGLSAAISGILILALSKGLYLLTEIRDVICFEIEDEIEDEVGDDF